MPTLKNNIGLKQQQKHWLLAGAFLFLLIVGAKIDLDFGERVSFTLQTLFLGLAYFNLPIRCRIVLISTYLLLGILGLPVFNGGVGWSYFSSYPLGFFVGFVVAAVFPIPKQSTFLSDFMYLIVLHLIILSFGILWLVYYNTLASAVQTMNGLLIGMVIKSLVGSFVVLFLKKIRQEL